MEVIGRYRAAERMLTRRLQSKIGKPGQASAPVGKALNTAANDCAVVVIKACQLAPATHAVRIDRKAIVKAFPSGFLGVMLRDPSTVAARRGDRSDVFFQHLANRGALQLLLQHLLPDRKLAKSLNDVVNHDDRAALICALTKVDLFIHQQGLDTTTASGRAMFGMLSVFSEFERAMIQSREGWSTARPGRAGSRQGAPGCTGPAAEGYRTAQISAATETAIRERLAAGIGMLKVAHELGVGSGTVQRVKREIAAVPRP